MRRFWSKVAIKEEDECWPWLAGRTGDYGVFKYQRTPVRAHRVAWELTYGNIPVDEWGNSLLILHKCDNPICCNPKHLFVGTDKDNANDREQKGRGIRPRRGGGFYSYGKWRVYIEIGGQKHFLGAYPTKEEANEIYMAAVRELEE